MKATKTKNKTHFRRSVLRLSIKSLNHKQGKTIRDYSSKLLYLKRGYLGFSRRKNLNILFICRFFSRRSTNVRLRSKKTAFSILSRSLPSLSKIVFRQAEHTSEEVCFLCISVANGFSKNIVLVV